MAELPKKLRLDNGCLEPKLDPVFKEFRSNKFQLETLQSALKNTADNTDNVVFLKIIEANAKSGSPFSKATCLVEEHLKPSNFPVCVTFRSIFAIGYEVLDHFLATGEIPKNKLFAEALQRLLTFLLQPVGNSPLLNESKLYGAEANWILVLIQHLLSKLSVSADYMIDGGTLKDITDDCPCQEKETLLCHRGNTSIGCDKGWRGELDIIFGDIPVKIAKGGEDDPVTETNTDSNSNLGAEEKTEFFTKSDRNQMLAQTIVFAFLKRQGLIPLVGIGSSYVKLHFYDCEKDILMRCNTMDYIYSKEKALLNTRTVLMLWFALNHELFCTGVPADMQDYRANFHEELCTYLDCYKNTVSPFPFHLKAYTEEPEMSLINIPAIDTFHKPNIEFLSLEIK